jgi:RNA polymerase sigma factor (sigma-70 family)
MKPTNHNKLSDALRGEMEQVYLTHREVVFKAAVRTLGNNEHAEDVLQNVFLNLLVIAADEPERLEGFRKNPRAYLYRSAVNEARNIMKAERRRRLSDDDTEMNEILIEGPDSDVAEDIRRIRTAMAFMEPDLADLLKLHYVEGNSCFAIGKIQGKAAPTVTVQLFRARNELKRVLRRQERNHGTQKAKIEGSYSASYPKTSEA